MKTDTKNTRKMYILDFWNFITQKRETLSVLHRVNIMATRESEIRKSISKNENYQSEDSSFHVGGLSTCCIRNSSWLLRNMIWIIIILIKLTISSLLSQNEVSGSVHNYSTMCTELSYYVYITLVLCVQNYHTMCTQL